MSERSWRVHVRVRWWGGTWQAWTDRRGGAAGYVCVCVRVCVRCAVDSVSCLCVCVSCVMAGSPCCRWGTSAQPTWWLLRGLGGVC